MRKRDGFVPKVRKPAPAREGQLVENGHGWRQPPLRRCDRFKKAADGDTDLDSIRKRGYLPVDVSGEVPMAVLIDEDDRLAEAVVKYMKDAGRPGCRHLAGGSRCQFVLVAW